jgi:ABC-type thiamin/hydroxymethylpyrimidine transport system permease subunit
VIMLYFFIGWWLIGVATVVGVAVVDKPGSATNGEVIKCAGLALLGPVLTIITACFFVAELPKTAWWDRVIWSRKSPKP